jgi:type II secretory pathway pseudopilin PulG
MRNTCGIRASGVTRPRIAFTLGELLVVISIIAVLMGLAIPGFMAWQRHARVVRTQAQVAMILAAIVNYDQRGKGIWSTQRADGSQVNFRLWDYNGDQRIDGRPEAEDPDPRNDPSDPLVRSGYRGLIAMTGLPLTSLDAAGRPLDAWRQPLHIAAAAGIYGDALFGVWSSGPDRLDGPPGSAAARDNLTSWGRP